jgi:hypothetical protein
MAVWVFLLVVAVAAAAVFVYYQRGRSTLGVSRPGTGSSGRLAQRVEDARTTTTEASPDEFVDAQAAVWDVGGERPAVDPDDLFVEDPPVVDPGPSRDRRDEFFDELPYAEDDDEDEERVDELDDGEPTASSSRPRGTPVITPTVFVLDEDEDVDRFAPRSSYVAGLADEDEEGGEGLALVADETEPAAADPLFAEVDEELELADDVDDEFDADEEFELEEEFEVDEDEDEEAVASDGPQPLARRTPKAGEEAYRRPLRLAQTTQRPSGTNRRSPDEVRSMLANYRGGLTKGRSEPTDDE